jgi:small subunit ribosomal protein S17
MARTLTGTVVSTKSAKTIIVAVETKKTHPIYKKQYKVTTRFAAHDEKSEAKDGDKVLIVETRPISATKRFKLDAVVTKAGIAHVDDTVAAKKPSTKKKTTESTEE